MLEGGSHASGNDVPLYTGRDGVQRRAEGGEGMAIFSRRATGKYGDILPGLVQAINRGEFENKYRAFVSANASLPMVSNTVNVNTGRMETELTQIRHLMGKKETYYNERGERVERIGNRTIIYRK